MRARTKTQAAVAGRAVLYSTGPGGGARGRRNESSASRPSDPARRCAGREARVDLHGHVLAGAERAADAGQRRRTSRPGGRGTRRPGAGRRAATCVATRQVEPGRVGRRARPGPDAGPSGGLVCMPTVVDGAHPRVGGRGLVAAAGIRTWRVTLPPGVDGRRAGRQRPLRVGQRLQRLVLDLDQGAARRAVSGGRRRPIATRLALAADDVPRQHRLVCDLEAEDPSAGTPRV